MTKDDKEILDAIRVWVKENPRKNIKTLKNIHRNFKKKFKEGLYDPIGETPQAGDNAFLLGHTNYGKIEWISNGKALVSYEPTDIAHHVDVSALVRNDEECRWEYITNYQMD